MLLPPEANPLPLLLAPLFLAWLCGCAESGSAGAVDAHDVPSSETDSSRYEADGTGGADIDDGAGDADSDTVPDLSDTEEPDVPPDPRRRLDWLAPTRQIAGASVPIRVRALDADGAIDPGVSGVIAIQVRVDGEVTEREVLLRRGVGALRLTMGAADLTLGAVGFDADTWRVALAEPARTLSGTLAGVELVWGPDELVIIDDVRVLEGAALMIAAGTTVVAAEDANLLIDGDIRVEGTALAPVVFSARTPAQAWGGVVVGGGGVFGATIFVDGGGDDTRQWGHSDSQAVVFGDVGSTIEVDGCVFQDSPGKSIGTLEATISIADTLVTRMDTGGEFRDSFATVRDSYFLDMPVVDGELIDDDNDAIYFWGTLEGSDGEPLVSSVTDSVFIGGLDDGIDHNGAVLTVDGAYISGFWNEGIAASNGGEIHIRDAWISDCEQGLEAGGVYGGAYITADHVVLIGNDVNVRWGDSSDPDLLSTIEITNAVIADAREQTVRNYHTALGGPNPNADIRISATLIDDEAWAGGEGSIFGDPTFDPAGMLAPESPGYEAGTDGASMGLTRPLR